VDRSSRRQKTNKLKLVKQCNRQESNIKALRFKMFLKWRRSAPIFHYVVNFIGHGRSGKFKAWFHGKKSIGIQFFGLNTFLYVIVKPKPQKPCWPYRHFKVLQWVRICKHTWTMFSALCNKIHGELKFSQISENSHITFCWKNIEVLRVFFLVTMTIQGKNQTTHLFIHILWNLEKILLYIKQAFLGR